MPPPVPTSDAAGDLPVTTLGPTDLADILDLDVAAFGSDPPSDFVAEAITPVLELDRFIGVRDPAARDELVASACILSKDMTFPGGAAHPVAAVSFVAVRAGWRGRGLMRGLMRSQLHGLHADGAEPVAILLASEGGLYGRFGYGHAIGRFRMELGHGAPFRRDVAVENVVEMRADQAWPTVDGIYERARRIRPGFLSRSAAVWAARRSDHAVVRSGASRMRVGLHGDGYVTYRVKDDWNPHGPNNLLRIQEICATTPEAWASLWRYVLDFALVRRVSYHTMWSDDPLRDLLLDPRALQATQADHIWLRIIDLDRAIALRTYRFPVRLVVRITDEFCPWNAGTWAVDLSGDGGSATRSTEPAQVSLDISDLGAAFMGGTPLSRLAAAGRVHGNQRALDGLGAALATPLAPWCPEGF